MKPKLKYNTIYNHSKEKEILNYKLNKICTEPVCWRLQRADEEIKEDLNKLIDIQCSWAGRLNIIMMSILPKLIYRVNAVSIKITVRFFVDTDKLILKFIWKGTGPRIAKQSFWKRRINGKASLYLILTSTVHQWGISGQMDT